MGFKNKVLIGVLLSGLIAGFGATESRAESDKFLYQEATRAAKSGNADFAFIYFHALTEQAINSRYYPEALFATGEYYFREGDLRQAETVFTEFIEKFPNSEAFPFAAVYLLQFWKDVPEQEFADELKKKIIKFKQLSLLFSEFKEYTFVSAMNFRYRAVYFIDRVEFYVNEELFERIYF